MKPLIIMALESEGQGIPEALGFETVYCGVGKVNAAYHLTRRLTQAQLNNEKIPYVLNLGSAGSTSFPRDSVIAVTHFVQRDMDARGIGFALGETPFDPHPPALHFPKQFAALQHGICGSGDSFAQTVSELPCDVVDMEAYALAKICAHEKLPFACVKYITDGADHEAARDWQDNLHLAAQAFKGLLQKLL